MNTPQKYKITRTGKAWSMEGLRPSEKVILLGLRIAAHERPGGVQKAELQAAVGLPESSFERGWTYALKNGLVERTHRPTQRRPTPEHVSG